MAKHFGTNGVRGLFNELDPMLALGLARAIGTHFNCGKILVARDARITGECLKHAVVAGLQSVGCQVVDLDYASAPTAEFMARRLKADGLIIITASHNPPEWNALKVVDGNGVTVSRERGEEIEKLMGKAGSVSWDKVRQCVPCKTSAAEHTDAIIALVDSKKIRSRKPKLVLDCGNGTAALVAPGLFERLGCDLVLINATMDGRFPGRPSEPTQANVSRLIEAVKASRADAGIAWDGDGDRVVFVDENGGYVIGDKVFALSVLWKLGKGARGDVVTTVATSRAAEDVAAGFKCRTRYTAIGAPYLSGSVAQSTAAIAGEEVGGVIWPELSLAKDGFMTAARMAEALCERPLSAWLKEIPSYYNVKKKIEAGGKDKNEIVARALAHAKAEKLDCVTLDGVRINFRDSWAIVRASGTEDYVRVFAEARSEAEAERLAEEWKKIALGG
jgi:phosphomannomutase/phosphoglucomutase